MCVGDVQVPLQFQSRALTWGIIGAVTMRGFMILVGVAAIQRFRWVILLFSGVLLMSALKLLTENHNDDEDLSGNWIMRFTKAIFPATDEYDQEKFFTKVRRR